jgi:hypothetical protein
MRNLRSSQPIRRFASTWSNGRLASTRMRALRAGALSLVATLLLGPAHSAGSSDFLPCVHRAISDLDDGVSPADVVGAAAVHECVTPQMFENCNEICSDALLKTFREDAAVRVLRYRVSKRASGK